MGKHHHTLFPCCKEATLLAEKRLQQPLPLKERVGLDIHLLLCRHCRRYVQQSKRIDKLLREYFTTLAYTSPDETRLAQWEQLIADKLKK
ncbi:hypothetical protein [Chitinophaga nivalis]|uniref:Anti-sigma factor n=1 Tax=Chitinophaga nivalis TaxID=2991709 RepID=A0ABT3IR29_9BACT|nr:hypothetical protein [Chitinophaga nivalis]MCW3463889.1 hypothetical protein [Chitinophaga nivalis]MCW3486421.1 hypothetical protein [Chitinophaga nivalis]